MRIVLTQAVRISGVLLCSSDIPCFTVWQCTFGSCFSTALFHSFINQVFPCQHQSQANKCTGGSIASRKGSRCGKSPRVILLPSYLTAHLHRQTTCHCRLFRVVNPARTWRRLRPYQLKSRPVPKAPDLFCGEGFSAAHNDTVSDNQRNKNP